MIMSKKDREPVDEGGYTSAAVMFSGLVATILYMVLFMTLGGVS